MKYYNELKKIAQPHIRLKGDLPSNAFLLLNQLHIPFKTEKQCEIDYNGKMTPLYNSPAFLSIDSNKKRTLYFNSNTRYCNFYIFHEIAHYLLGHENDSPQNEIEADLLACILAAPIENLPSTVKSARDLSSISQLPIDKAEMYWDEIKKNLPKSQKKILISAGIVFIAFLTVICFNCFNSTRDTNGNNEAKKTTTYTVAEFRAKNFEATSNIPEPVTEKLETIEKSETVTEETATTEIDKKSEALDQHEDKFYITSSGTHYHKADCQYVKNKTNIISVSYKDIDNLKVKPCKKCIK